jgi:hypothetical protein
VTQLPTEWRTVLAQETSDTDLLTLLASDENLEVRLAVAKNPATPPAVLATLANDENWEVRRAAAYNPATPPAALALLVNEEDLDVRQAAVENSATPPELRAAILTASRDSADHARAAILHAPWNALRPIHPSVIHLREVSMVDVSDIDVQWPEKPESIFDLPGRDSLPWSIDEAVLTLNGKTVKDGSYLFTLEVLESPHALKQNANHMGNCTHDNYAKYVAEGRCVIVALWGKDKKRKDGDKDKDKIEIVYNAEFVASNDGTWKLEQVNSRFNQGGVPPKITEQLRGYAQSIAKK